MSHGLDTGVDADGTDTGRRIGRRVVLRRCSNGQEKRNEHVDEGHAEESQDRGDESQGQGQAQPDQPDVGGHPEPGDCQRSRSDRRGSAQGHPEGVKTRRETAKLYEDKGLADKAAPETAEADFLETFLPAAASDEDYAKAVADAVAEVNPAGPKDMGRVVKAARAALAGKTIDGGKLAGLVKAELNK